MKFLNRHIPVLMYHRVHATKTDFLTVSESQLDRQFKYLSRKKFESISVKQLIDFQLGKGGLPSRPILITFDDAHISFENLALPQLNNFDLKATVFIPTNLLGTHHIDCGEILSVEAIRKIQLENTNIEYALHTHNHFAITQLSNSEIEKEIEDNMAFFKQNQLQFTSSLAYPYGARFKASEEMDRLKLIFQKHGIESAFRIGNRLNPYEIKELYDINRLDIRGTDSYLNFLFKINFGKLF